MDRIAPKIPQKIGMFLDHRQRRHPPVRAESQASARRDPRRQSHRSSRFLLSLAHRYLCRPPARFAYQAALGRSSGANSTPALVSGRLSLVDQNRQFHQRIIIMAETGKRRISILGSTGSIGVNTLDVDEPARRTRCLRNRGDHRQCQYRASGRGRRRTSGAKPRRHRRRCPLWLPSRTRSAGTGIEAAAGREALTRGGRPGCRSGDGGDRRNRRPRRRRSPRRNAAPISHSPTRNVWFPPASFS